jgi:hypothetical protein
MLILERPHPDEQERSKMMSKTEADPLLFPRPRDGFRPTGYLRGRYHNEPAQKSSLVHL